MALTGLQIQKLLPKTNCKECGSNTCLAFAMKLAGKKAELSECPYASDEAKRVLGAASEPPVQVRRARAGRKLEARRRDRPLPAREDLRPPDRARGQRQRHRRARRHRRRRSQAVKDYVLERVGREAAHGHGRGDPEGRGRGAFVALAKKAWAATKQAARPAQPRAAALAAAAAAVKGSRQRHRAPVAEAAERLWRGRPGERPCAGHHRAGPRRAGRARRRRSRPHGFNDLVLQFQTHSPGRAVPDQFHRPPRGAQGQLQALGYPTLRFIETGDLLDDTVEAVTEINKYGGICVLPAFDPAQLASLMTLRLNIYTDPQKPIQVEPKVYRHRRAEGRFAGLRDHQFLADLFHRFRRNREQRHQRLAGRAGMRGHERAHRLGGRQVLRRDRSPSSSRRSASKNRSTRASSSSPATSPRSAASWRKACPAGRSWSARRRPATSRASSRPG